MGRLASAWRIWRRQGTLRVVQRIVQRRVPAFFVPPSSVRFEDAAAVDWETPHPAVAAPVEVTRERLVVAWVMSPPGAFGGGHQNIFRFMRVLEDAGHEVRIYLYSETGYFGPEEVRALLAGSNAFTEVAASIEHYPADGAPDDVDVIVACNWPTAYRSYRDDSTARRFYFVQDFEPAFYPASSESVLAENTYRFGFFGITAGRWLAAKLARDYGMPTSSYDFGSDPAQYTMSNLGERSDVCFYARPSTARRGFELGIMALQLFHQARPDHGIHLVGQRLKGLAIPFPHSAPGPLGLTELDELYNRCRAGLTISLTNMSLLPLELLASGVIPVVNDGENNRAVSDNPFIEYVALSPRAMADRLIEVVDRPDASEHAVRASQSVQSSTWEVSAAQFLHAFERGLRQ